MNLSAITKEFLLSEEQIRKIRDTHTERILEGLSCVGAEIAALPAYLPRPKRAPEGTALVIDIGGTNVRAALVELRQGTARVLDGPVQAQVETGRDYPVSAERFFRAQAELASQLEVPPLTPVGYCFSYPAAITPNADAKLIAWTKGIRIPDVVGTAVGSRLRRELQEQGMQPGRLVVLNDTVAALLSGCAVYHRDFDRFIGMIAGTGFNLAGLFPTSRVTKLDPRDYHHDDIAINLEAGNFQPPFTTVWDEMLDKESDNPGRQLMEKASSGFYMPFLYQTVARDIGLDIGDFDPNSGTGALVKLAYELHDELAAAILQRSGRLLAATLSGLMQAIGAGKFAVAIEGSRFWKDQALVENFASIMRTVTRGDQDLGIFQIANANLVGSACAALS